PPARRGSRWHVRIRAASGELGTAMSFPGRSAGLLLALAACATSSGGAAPGSVVVLDPPGDACAPLGPVSVRWDRGVAANEDALFSSAVRQLQLRAAARGATHLLLSPASMPAAMAQGTKAAASGLAFRCPPHG